MMWGGGKEDGQCVGKSNAVFVKDLLDDVFSSKVDE